MTVAFAVIPEQTSLHFGELVVSFLFTQLARPHGGMNFPLHGMELLVPLPPFTFGVVALALMFVVVGLMSVSPFTFVTFALAFSTSVLVKGPNLAVGFLLAQFPRPHGLVNLARSRVNAFPPGPFGFGAFAVSAEQMPLHLTQFAFRMFLAQLPRLHGGPQFALHGAQLFTFGMLLTLPSMVTVLFPVSALPFLSPPSVFVNRPQFSVGFFLAELPRLHGGAKFLFGRVQALPFRSLGLFAFALFVTMGVLALALPFRKLSRSFAFFFMRALSPAFIVRLRRHEEGAARQQEGERKGYGLSGLHSYFLHGFVMGNVHEQGDGGAPPLSTLPKPPAFFPKRPPKA